MPPRRGEWERAERPLRAALGAARADAPGLRARIQADLGLTLHQAGDRRRRRRWRARRLALAEAAEDSRAQAQAHNMLGVLAHSRGDREAAAELDRSLVIAREMGDESAQTAALNNLALVGEMPGIWTRPSS